MPTRSRFNLSQVILGFTIGILAWTDFGCAPSRLTNMWTDPTFKNTPMRNILVVAAKNNPVNRRIWEDEIVAELSAYGVAATPSYRAYPDSIPNPEQVGAAVQEKKFDGVLFIRRLPTQVSTNYIPGYTTSEPVTRYNERTKSYSTYYREVQQPGYTDTTKTIRQEIDVFSTKGGSTLVWAGTGEMINPSSREAVRNEITGLFVPELSRQGIIPPK
jgi:hypothetical protein